MLKLLTSEPALVDAPELRVVPEPEPERSAPWALRYGVSLLLCGLLGLMLWAGHTDYALRVTSDSPTFLALVQDMADSPLGQQSPFVADPAVASAHATPYVQALGFLCATSTATAGSRSRSSGC